jgi:putative addiction module antidote
MHQTVAVRMIDGELTVTVPSEMMERLNVGEGDKLFIVEKDDGILLTPHDPVSAKVMEAYRQIAQKYGNALRELAGQ